MSEPHDNHHDHPHDDDHGHASGGDDHGHLPGPVRSALGLLADGIDKARNLAGPAGEKARHVTDMMRDESADIFDKVRDEGTQVVNKLRGHTSSSSSSDAYSTAGRSDKESTHDKTAEALDIAKTVGAALLVGTVKVVQLALKEWQAHTGNASTPEDNAPSAGAKSAWDSAGTPKAPDSSASGGAAAGDADEESFEPQPQPEVNNWDDIEAESNGGDVWAQETDGPTASSTDESVTDEGDSGGTAAGDPLVGATATAEDSEEVVYTSESELFDASTVATEAEIDPDSTIAPDDDSGPALQAEPEPAHSGHSAQSTHSAHDDADHVHSDAPLEGFDEMTIGSLRGRLGSLSADDLEALRDYERQHADRPQVLTMLENRLAKVNAHGHVDHSDDEHGGEA